MKKTIAIIGVSGALLWLGASYFTGSIAEKETRNFVDQLNTQSQEYGLTNIEEYDRGLFQSKVSYTYNLPAYFATLLDYKESIKFSCDYKHGLVGIDYSCDFLENGAYQKFLDENFAGENPVHITGAISAFGGLTQHISVDAINKETDDGGLIKVDPSLISVESTDGLKQYDVRANIGEIEIKDKDGVLNLSEIIAKADLTKTDLGLFAGTYSLITEKLAVKGEAEDFSMTGLEFTGVATDRNETMDSIGELKVGNIANKKNDMFSVEDTVLSFDFLGVNSEALVAYQEFARNLQTDLMANLEHGGEPEIDPNQMMALLPIVEKMLDKDLNLKVAAKAKLDGQPNNFDFNLKLLEKMTFTQLSAFMFDPASVLKKMNIEFSTSIHESVLKDNPAALEAIKQNPMVISKDGSYSTKLILGENSSLNGKAVTIQELQAMLMAGAL